MVVSLLSAVKGNRYKYLNCSMANIIGRSRSSYLFKQLLIYHITVQSRYAYFSVLLTVIKISYIPGHLKFIEGIKGTFKIEKKRLIVKKNIKI